MGDLKGNSYKKQPVLEVLRRFVGLSLEGLDVNVQAKRTKDAKAP